MTDFLLHSHYRLFSIRKTSTCHFNLNRVVFGANTFVFYSFKKRITYSIRLSYNIKLSLLVLWQSRTVSLSTSVH